MHADTTSFGFPLGYFCIKSTATGRFLDVSAGKQADDTDVILWPAKDQSLVENLRSPAADNQVFFVDSTGALCSKASGHAIDVLGDHLVLRHRRPISYPYPNPYSHPLPQFSYNEKNGRISITFEYPPYAFSKRADWDKNVYLLVSTPRPRPASVIDNASKFFSSAVSSSMTLFSGASTRTEVTPDAVFAHGDIDLKEDEIMDEDRGEENEVDDSAEPLRLAHVISIPKPQENAPTGPQAAVRRQWEILPMRATRARYSGEGPGSPRKMRSPPQSPTKPQA